MFDIILEIECTKNQLNNFLTNEITNRPNYHLSLNAHGRYITDLYLIPIQKSKKETIKESIQKSIQKNFFLIHISHHNIKNFIQNIKKYDIHDQIKISIGNYYTTYGKQDLSATISYKDHRHINMQWFNLYALPKRTNNEISNNASDSSNKTNITSNEINLTFDQTNSLYSQTSCKDYNLTLNNLENIINQFLASTISEYKKNLSIKYIDQNEFISYLNNCEEYLKNKYFHSIIDGTIELKPLISIPFTYNLNHAISYTKGCYLGQEITMKLFTQSKPKNTISSANINTTTNSNSTPNLHSSTHSNTKPTKNAITNTKQTKILSQYKDSCIIITPKNSI